MRERRPARRILFGAEEGALLLTQVVWGGEADALYVRRKEEAPYEREQGLYTARK